MKLLFLMFPLFLFGSCSIYKIANSHVCGKLKAAGLRQKELQTGRYTLNYWDSENDKPVLLLIHGFGASTEFQWYKQAKALSKKYRLVLPNLLFFGGSSSTLPDYRIQDQVAAVQALLDHLKIDQFYAAGTSYGGLVAAELALQQPDKIIKLALFDSPIKFFKEEEIAPLYEELGVKTPSDLLVPNDPALLRTLLKIAYYKPPKVPYFILKDMHKYMYVEQAEEKRELLRHLSADSQLLSERAYPFSFPILLIWGAEDHLIPVKIGEQLAAYFGENARLELIPKAAHAPNLEQAKTFNTILLNFLNE